MRPSNARDYIVAWERPQTLGSHVQRGSRGPAVQQSHAPEERTGLYRGMGNASNARLSRSARLAWAGGPAELCARVTHGIISWHGKRLKRSPRTFRAARVGRRAR